MEKKSKKEYGICQKPNLMLARKRLNKITNSVSQSHWSYFKCSTATRVLVSIDGEHFHITKSSNGQHGRRLL